MTCEYIVSDRLGTMLRRLRTVSCFSLSFVPTVQRLVRVIRNHNSVNSDNDNPGLTHTHTTLVLLGPETSRDLPLCESRFALGVHSITCITGVAFWLLWGAALLHGSVEPPVIVLNARNRAVG